MKTVQDERWDKGFIFVTVSLVLCSAWALAGCWNTMSNSFDFGRWLYRYSLGLGKGASGHTMLSLDSSPLVIPLPAGRAPWSQRPSSSSSSTFSILLVSIILNWLPNSTYICLDFHLYCKSGSWWWDTFMFLHLALFAHSSTFSFLIWYSCPATSISDNFIRSLVAVLWQFFGSSSLVAEAWNVER